MGHTNRPFGSLCGSLKNDPQLLQKHGGGTSLIFLAKFFAVDFLFFSIFPRFAAYPGAVFCYLKVLKMFFPCLISAGRDSGRRP